MTLDRHRLRLVAAVFAVAVITGGVYMVAAQEEHSPQAAVTPVVGPPVGLEILAAIPAQDQSDLPTVSPEESARARDALAADEVFGRMTRGTGWRIVQSAPNTRDGEKIGVALIVELDRPVDSEGPWRQFGCQGTVIHEYQLGYQDITLLGATFDAEGRELLALTPLAPSSGQPLTFERNVELPEPECPPGAEEDEGY